MNTRASNSELVEPLPEPERSLNRRLCRQNRRIPFEQRNNPPQHPRIGYPLILNIIYFPHFLDILRNYDPMDDEPMWSAYCVVALTPSSAITIPETANEFVIKEYVSGKSYDPPDNPNDHQNNFETPINFDSDDEDDEPTPQPKPKTPKPFKETPTPKPYKPKIPYHERLRKEKMEAQYGKFLDMIRAGRINVHLFDVLARIPNYGNFLKELVNNKHKMEQISAAFLSDESSSILQNKVPPKLGDHGSFLIS
ncbi:hypothetical protein Tco_0704717 [Tanacetum coccineum]|uniref:Reverse transcriptase domain-containing protein n=1 Tax=Tanacetum coccineum TaxID=301880 RepID=A0ABQ4Y2S3_9ASTR